MRTFGTPTATVFRFGFTPVTTDDVGELARGDVVMVAPLAVGMHIELVERISLQLFCQRARRFVGAVDRVAVEGETDHWRVSCAVVGPGRLHAGGILVIVVERIWRRVPAAAPWF